MKIGLGIVVLVGVLAWAGQVEGSQGEYKLAVSEDAWVNQANVGANYGTNTYLSLNDRTGLAEIYLKFNDADLAALAGMRIVSAELFMYQYQGTYSPGDAVCARAALAGWDEGSLTWDNKPAYAAVGSSLALESGNNTWREWTGLSDVVTGWMDGANYGLVLENGSDGTGELFARFYSSEYSKTDLRPYLNITTTVNPEPVSAVLFLSGAGVIYCRRHMRKRKEKNHCQIV